MKDSKMCGRIFLKIPYLSIVFFMLFLGGVAVEIVCVVKIGDIYARFAYDMFKRYCLWIKDVKIFLISFHVYTVLLMCYNLMIAFRNTAIVTIRRVGSGDHRVYCLDSAIVQKILNLVNHISLVAIFVHTLIATIAIFVCATLKALCVEGSNVSRWLLLDPYKIGVAPGESGQRLDLREFTPLVGLRSNETIYLYLENDRLKIFCDDYVSILYVYNCIHFGAALFAAYAMFALVCTYSFNISRNFTKKKLLEEHLLLNASELRELSSD